MTQQFPDFKAGYKYQNIGNIVGTLNYAKEMKKKDGITTFGYEFLINARGFGSINVRIPMIDKAQNSLDNFPVSEKPRVRAGLSRIEQFTTDKGKTYTNATTFVELSEAKTAAGADMNDNIAGRVAGEIFNIRPLNNNQALAFDIVTYPVQRDDESKRAVLGDGKPVDPQVLKMEVHDPTVIHQIQQTVRNGSNVEVGYKYLNKSDVQYDDYGFPINDPNSVIERLECGKIVVHGAPQPQNQGFGGNPQGGFGGGNPQGGFGGQGGFGSPNPQGGFGGGQFGQQQQGFGGGGPDFSGSENNFGVKDSDLPFGGGNGFGQGGGDPFAGGQVLPPNDPFAQQANQYFGNGQPNGQGFGFGN